MNKSLLPLLLTVCCIYLNTEAYGQTNYLDYHNEVIKGEQLVAARKFKAAIAHFDALFDRFDFVFLRDCKLAAQLCAFVQDKEYGIRFLSLGVSNGWPLKEIKKNDRLRFLEDDPKWESLQLAYDSLHRQYLKGLNSDLKKQVHLMFKKDQRKAIGALFRIGQKAKDKYAEKKFAPHSEKQLRRLNEILDQYGYPGERLIGNDWQVSVILSHHNSISKEYNSKDVLYADMKPKLINALKNGEVSPYVLATIEDWRTAALSGHESTSYGFLGGIPNDSALEIVNKNRSQIGLRSIELRNALIDLEQETGLNLYLPKDWQNGKIRVTGKR